MIWCIKIETENKGTIYVEGDTEQRKIDTIKEYLLEAKSITIDHYKDELEYVELKGRY